MMIENLDTILLIDDDEIFVEVLAKALERRGFHVLKSTNLTQALNLAEESPPDYAVIDLKIDKESGLDCLEKLKAINSDIAMLILTGYSSIATAVTAIKLGAIDYACKPLDTEEILSILTNTKKRQVEGADIKNVSEEPTSIKRIQWEHIQRVLDDNNGNISATARNLGMHRRTLQRKLQKKPVKK